MISGVAALLWIFKSLHWLSKLKILLYVCIWCLILKYWSWQILWKLEIVFLVIVYDPQDLPDDVKDELASLAEELEQGEGSFSVHS